MKWRERDGEEGGITYCIKKELQLVNVSETISPDEKWSQYVSSAAP